MGTDEATASDDLGRSEPTEGRRGAAGVTSDATQRAILDAALDAALKSLYATNLFDDVTITREGGRVARHEREHVGRRFQNKVKHSVLT